MSFDPLFHRRIAASRRLVLGIALAAGLALAIVAGGGAPTREPSRADRPRGPSLIIADTSAADLMRVQDSADSKSAASPKPTATPDPPATVDAARPKVDTEISIGESGVVIRKNRRGDGNVSGGDYEFDSFEEFVEKAPWIAAMVFMVTALVFLVPVFVIALIIWYKIRSNRMRNETMLKLAERGVVPPAEAIAALSQPGASLQTTPSMAPLYEQAKQIRKRTAWSDLRKGVIMGGIGLGLTFYSMLSGRDANALGLVLLFVGIGYGVLWYFEDRQLQKPGDTDPRSPGGA